MKNTWASGAIELLRHADSHIELESAFDKRIAFISIDNAVETLIRTYLSLPKSKSGVKISRKDLEEADTIFPKLVALLFENASEKLIGIDDADIEHYHRIRNKLYHDGTGLSVDDQYLRAYRGIANVLLENLFEVSVEVKTEEALTLEYLIVNFNKIEKIVKQKLEEHGLFGTYKWEESFSKGIFTPDIVQSLTELRMARNRLVHSDSIDKNGLIYWALRSDAILKKLDDGNKN